MTATAVTPLTRPGKPDFDRFLQVLRRAGDASYVPFLEMVFEPSYLEPLSGLPAPREMNFCPTSPHYEASFGYYLEACARIGFDHGTINLCGFTGYPVKRHASGAIGRSFVRAADCAIVDEASCAAYPWPSADQLDLEAMERTARMAPDGMGVLTGGPAPFQTLTELLGFDNLCILLYENPALVRAVADRLGAIMVEVADRVCALDCIDGFFHTGDMGYKTGTMIAPDDLRTYILPWHKRVVDAVHAHGKVCLLHSCGNLAEIMPDIIACGYDGKHSFEDAITPGILELHSQYGDQICLIGGMDVDFLCRSSEEAIRERVRTTIEAMGPNGGYILGSGNSIPEYCPVEKWWAMLDEGLKVGRVKAR